MTMTLYNSAVYYDEKKKRFKIYSLTLYLLASETTHFYQGGGAALSFLPDLGNFLTFYFYSLKVCIRGADRPNFRDIAPKLFE